MNLKKFALMSVITFSSLPILAEADITIINNTDYYGTAYFDYSPCSSVLSDRGIAKPHQSLTLPTKIIKMFCGSSKCAAYIFKSQDCSGDKVAIATVDVENGVTQINNSDPQHFKVTGLGNTITVDQLSKLWNWFKLLF